MVSPSLTASWTFSMAWEITTLPAVSRVMLSAWRMGTPEVTRVPRVREKRETALLRWMSPRTGMLEFYGVHRLAAALGAAPHVEEEGQ